MATSSVMCAKLERLWSESSIANPQFVSELNGSSPWKNYSRGNSVARQRWYHRMDFCNSAADRKKPVTLHFDCYRFGEQGVLGV